MTAAVVLWADDLSTATGGAPSTEVDLQGWLGGSDGRFLRPQLSADDVRALCERGRLVEGDRSRYTLTTESAIGRQREVLRIDVLEGVANVRCHRFGGLDLKIPVADETHRNLLCQLSFVGLEQR